ncbi:hypothetical protein V3C99_010697 [Haemonchus contortus]
MMRQFKLQWLLIAGFFTWFLVLIRLERQSWSLRNNYATIMSRTPIFPRPEDVASLGNSAKASLSKEQNIKAEQESASSMKPPLDKTGDKPGSTPKSYLLKVVKNPELLLRIKRFLMEQKKTKSQILPKTTLGKVGGKSKPTLPLKPYTKKTEKAKSAAFVNPTIENVDGNPKSTLSIRPILEEDETKPKFLFKVTSASGEETFYGEDILTGSNITLEERMTCNFNDSEPPRLIYSEIHGGSLGGCPDWNCKLINDLREIKKAHAIVMYSDYRSRRNDQYLVFYSQEAPTSIAGITEESARNAAFNMSIGYRQDSPLASPYGYTVKLANESRRTFSTLNMSAINGKTLGAAWFVTNCITPSSRESYVRNLKTYFPVDIYGECSGIDCQHNGFCEKMLDEDYHFYLSFENSVCEDYITEKLWKHGYMHDVVPIVLKRSIVEPYVPPYSFIAVDDFRTAKDLAKYLHYLMDNKTAYLEYFEWRLNYQVVFLDGVEHNELERPWGFCQLCRLIWEEPRKQYIIANFTKYWFDSCEKAGFTVDHHS